MLLVGGSTSNPVKKRLLRGASRRVPTGAAQAIGIRKEREIDPYELS